MLHGKIALITGSAKGLGKRTALALADLGCDVAINYVNSENEAYELADRIQAKGVRALAVRADIASRDDNVRMIETIAQTWGHVDILVNNAGPFVRERRTFDEYGLDEIDYMMRGNLLGVMQLDRLVLPGMRSSRWGRIIHFGFGRASEARGWPHRAAYAAAKVGLVSLTKTLAEEQAAFGVTVNMVCPGDIRGINKEKGIAEVAHLSDEEFPGIRPGSGEDVARVIAFLCMPQSDFLTGNVMEVSGGFDPIRSIAAQQRQNDARRSN
ncbi:SDR family oxidoreductase [Paenibacillus mesophilus]|uniref:SDR family oxidoreductase n=1 Tax=Paenibacillus mesophilus TaxID=2582849 RepID=UPI00110E3D07|nr:SDR family oxidoreductase [Paenibacillus mesophilus]TMV47288.1 SDR family oxidoreductase [Paenibacillus mesophilus]